MMSDGNFVSGALLGVVVAAASLNGGDVWGAIFPDKSWEGQAKRLETYFRNNRQGSSGDVWLVKGNFGVEDRVAVFYGYLDDWAACIEFATAYQALYPADIYSCRFAN